MSAGPAIVEISMQDTSNYHPTFCRDRQVSEVRYFGQKMCNSRHGIDRNSDVMVLILILLELSTDFYIVRLEKREIEDILRYLLAFD